jgi:hypothetical protein
MEAKLKLWNFAEFVLAVNSELSYQYQGIM